MPVHRRRATLITTADHDDRVVPAHSFKCGNAAGAGQPGESRADSHRTQSGHGASSTTQLIESVADVYAFIMHNLGVRLR